MYLGLRQFGHLYLGFGVEHITHSIIIVDLHDDDL